MRHEIIVKREIDVTSMRNQFEAGVARGVARGVAHGDARGVAHGVTRGVARLVESNAQFM